MREQRGLESASKTSNASCSAPDGPDKCVNFLDSGAALCPRFICFLDVYNGR